MRTHHLVAGIALLLVLPSSASAQEERSDKVPIGAERLTAYIGALNANDHDTYLRFVEEHLGPGAGAERQLRTFRLLATVTGGLELYRIEEGSGSPAVALARQKRDDAWVRVELELDPEPPHFITNFGLALTSPPAEAVAVPLSEAGLVDELRGHLESLAAADQLSGAVLLARRGEVLFQGAYGQARRGDGAMATTPETRFRLASLAKMLTAVAVARLADAGRLAFSDRLIDHLADFPDRELASRVTLHHLLTHTSGLGPAADERWAASREELFGAVAQAGLETAPGERFSYSNAGFSLLRRVVEAASGMSYCDYTRRHVFAPAGMSATTACTRGDEPGLAVPYTRGMDDHHGFQTDGPRRAHTLAAGSPLDVASSTVGDLHRLAQALAGGKLLRRQTRARLFEGHAAMPGETRYGYGFIVRGEGTTRSVRHGGGAPGISTSFELYPESGWTVVVLTNDDPHSAERVTRPLETWLARAIRPAEPSA